MSRRSNIEGRTDYERGEDVTSRRKYRHRSRSTAQRQEHHSDEDQDGPQRFAKQIKNIELPFVSAIIGQKEGNIDNFTETLDKLSDTFGGTPNNGRPAQPSNRNTDNIGSINDLSSNDMRRGIIDPSLGQSVGCGGCDDNKCSPARGNFGTDFGYSVRNCEKRDDCGCKNDRNCCVPPDMVVPMADPKCIPTLTVPYGFVASMLSITDVAQLPFVLTPSGDSILEMTPNAPLFNAEDLADAIGTSVSILPGIGIPLCAMLPTVFLLSNLPGTYAQYNGLYVLISDNPLRLMRIEWVHDPCAPNVGSMIELLYGSTANVWKITEINDNCQTISVESTGLRYIREYRIKRVQPRRKCKKYYEVTTCAPQTPCWT